MDSFNDYTSFGMLKPQEDALSELAFHPVMDQFTPDFGFFGDSMELKETGFNEDLGEDMSAVSTHISGDLDDEENCLEASNECFDEAAVSKKHMSPVKRSFANAFDDSTYTDEPSGSKSRRVERSSDES
jgi:hypothetical protein